MKNLVILLLLFLGACSTSVRYTPEEKELQTVVDSISRIFIPDSREDVRVLEAVVRNGTVILKGMTNREDLHRALVSYLDERYDLIDSSMILPASGLGADTFGLIRNSVANLRSFPRHSSQLVTQSLMGAPVKVYKKNGGWYLIRTVENYIAWVDDGGLTLMNKKEMDRWQQSQRLVFTDLLGKAYMSPAMQKEVTDLVLGVVVQVVKNTDPLEIRLPDGRLAYANANQFQALEEWSKTVKPTAEKTLKIAKSLLGRPYLWGGTSVYGMDCSGFTKTIFLKQGLILPRDASQQVKVGKPIELDKDLSQLRPGDLIFFGSLRDDGSERITHVAIYMGDGKIIHATGRVRIESLNPEDSLFNKHRYETMLEARRYIGYENRDDLLPVSASHYFE